MTINHSGVINVKYVVWHLYSGVGLPGVLIRIMDFQEVLMYTHDTAVLQDIKRSFLWKWLSLFIVFITKTDDHTHEIKQKVLIWLRLYYLNLNIINQKKIILIKGYFIESRLRSPLSVIFTPLGAIWKPIIVNNFSGQITNFLYRRRCFYHYIIVHMGYQNSYF